MNIEDYIESGILQDYCLGILSEEERAWVEEMCAKYPKIKEELTEIQQALEKYSTTSALAPGSELQNNIWGALENINKERHGDLNDLPVINKYSNYNHWKRIVLPLIPEDKHT